MLAVVMSSFAVIATAECDLAQQIILQLARKPVPSWT
jgi:hypothetical protein